MPKYQINFKSVIVNAKNRESAEKEDIYDIEIKSIDEVKPEKFGKGAICTLENGKKLTLVIVPVPQGNSYTKRWMLLDEKDNEIYSSSTILYSFKDLTEQQIIDGFDLYWQIMSVRHANT